MKKYLVRVPIVVAMVLGFLALAPAAQADPAISSGSDGIFPTTTANTYDVTATIRGTGFVSGAAVHLVERRPGDNSVEEVIAAANNGTVNSGGTTISGVVLPTTGLAPTTPLTTRPDQDVSWFIRVTNPDGKTSFSTELTVTGGTPRITNGSALGIKQGESKELVLSGEHFSKRTAFSIDDPDPSTDYPSFDGIEISNPRLTGTSTYRVIVSVPEDYPTGNRTLAMKNTDGKGSNECACITVLAADKIHPTPVINKITPTSAMNTTTIDATVYGLKFIKDTTTAKLVGYCYPDEPECGIKNYEIPLTGGTVTKSPISPAPATVDERTDDQLKGKLDLLREAPGRYSLVVENGPGAKAVKEKTFDVLAQPPSVPTPGSPYALVAGETQTLTISGANFAKGDRVVIGDVTQIGATTAASNSLSVQVRPDTAAIDGLRDLKVIHTDGAVGSCAGCVKITNTKTPVERYIIEAYRLFQNPDPSAAAINSWKSKFAGGTSRLELTRLLSRSDPYAGAEIERLYQVTLGRKSDAGGMATWMDQVRRGERIDVIATKFFGSPEYFGRKGGTNKGYVEALYVDILGRTHDPKGRDDWVAHLDSGRMSRVRVAAGFYGSSESRHKRAARLYQNAFDVAPTSTQRGPWATMAGQLGDLEVAARIAASDEYYKYATTGVRP